MHVSSLPLIHLEVSDENVYPQQRMSRNICELTSAIGRAKEMILEWYGGRMELNQHRGETHGKSLVTGS